MQMTPAPMMAWRQHLLERVAYNAATESQPRAVVPARRDPARRPAQWRTRLGRRRASKVADTNFCDTVVLDVDATLVTAHSEKQGAAVTFKKKLRLLAARGVVREHPRVAGPDAAPRERRVQYRG